MIKPPEIICQTLDIIKTTLATCQPAHCSQDCFDYLMNLGFTCPMIFRDETYDIIWRTLIGDCLDQGIETTFNPFQPINH